MVTGIGDPKVKQPGLPGEPAEAPEAPATPGVTPQIIGAPPVQPPTVMDEVGREEVSRVDQSPALGGLVSTTTDLTRGPWRQESTQRSGRPTTSGAEPKAHQLFLGQVFGVYDRQPTTTIEPGRLVQTQNLGSLDRLVATYRGRLEALAQQYPKAFTMPSDEAIRWTLAASQGYAQLDQHGANGDDALGEQARRFLANPRSFELAVLPDLTSLLSMLAMAKNQPPSAEFEEMREAELRKATLAYINGLSPARRATLVSGVLHMMESAPRGLQVLNELRSRKISDEEIAAEFMARTRFEGGRSTRKDLQRLESARPPQVQRDSVAAPSAVMPKDEAENPVQLSSVLEELEAFGITEREIRAITKKDLAVIRKNLVEAADVRDAKAGASIDVKDAEAAHGVPGQLAAVLRQEARAAADRRRQEAILDESRVAARKVNDKVADADEQERRQVAQEAVDRNLEERDQRNADHDTPRRPAPKAGHPR